MICAAFANPSPTCGALIQPSRAALLARPRGLTLARTFRATQKLVNLGRTGCVTLQFGNWCIAGSCVRPVAMRPNALQLVNPLQGQARSQMSRHTLISVNAGAAAIGKDLLESSLLPRLAMLIEKIKYAVVGLLLGLGLLLLPQSGLALAHGLVRDGHTTAANRTLLRLVGTSIRIDISATRTLAREAAAMNAALGHARVLKSSPATSRAQTSFTSCGHAGDCDCCGAKPGCCGMSCCVSVPPIGAPILPNNDGPALTIPASEPFQAGNFGMLFRPPRALA